LKTFHVETNGAIIQYKRNIWLVFKQLEHLQLVSDFTSIA
jgi:hypothetical protein